MLYSRTLRIDHLSNHFGPELALWAACLRSCVETLEDPMLLARMTYNGLPKALQNRAAVLHQECVEWIRSEVAAELMHLFGVDHRRAIAAMEERGLLKWPREVGL